MEKCVSVFNHFLYTSVHIHILAESLDFCFTTLSCTFHYSWNCITLISAIPMETFEEIYWGLWRTQSPVRNTHVLLFVSDMRPCCNVTTVLAQKRSFKTWSLLIIFDQQQTAYQLVELVSGSQAVFFKYLERFWMTKLYDFWRIMWPWGLE